MGPVLSVDPHGREMGAPGSFVVVVPAALHLGGDDVACVELGGPLSVQRKEITRMGLA